MSSGRCAGNSATGCAFITTGKSNITAPPIPSLPGTVPETAADEAEQLIASAVKRPLLRKFLNLVRFHHDR
jgi:hypothetical protein